MSKVEEIRFMTQAFLSEPLNNSLSLDEKVNAVYKKMNFDSFWWSLAYIFTFGYFYFENKDLIQQAINETPVPIIIVPKPVYPVFGGAAPFGPSGFYAPSPTSVPGTPGGPEFSVPSLDSLYSPAAVVAEDGTTLYDVPLSTY